MREKINIYKGYITEEIIKTDFEDKEKKCKTYVKMTKIDYLKRLLNLLKILENDRS